MARFICEIANEAFADMRALKAKPVSAGFPTAYPYLLAMLEIDSISGSYGMDSAKSIVLYFLANAGQWRGEVARRVKKELNEMLK